MADILDGLVAHLLAATGVTALVGAASAARIYAITLPQTPTFPCLTYQLISTIESEDHEGPAGLDEIQVQVDVWCKNTSGKADGFAAMKALAAAVRAAVVSYTGVMGTVRVHHVAVDGPRDFYEEELGIFRRQLDLTIWHES